MDPARRRLWIFAIAALAPAAALGFLALRSMRAEDSIRRAETDDQVRAFLKVAARETQADLDARFAELKSNPGPAVPISVLEDPPDLSESVRRERPDLLPLLHRAHALEFSDSGPKNASAIFVELANSIEAPTTRGRLIASAARCARKAGAEAEAVKLYERLIADHPDVRGESLLPLGTSARLHLLSLGGDREKLVGELMSVFLDPASEIVLLGRLEGAGIPTGDRLERARILQLASTLTLREGEVRWFKGSRGMWAVFLKDGGLRAQRVEPVPSAVVAARLQELARVGGLAYRVGEGQGAEVAGGALTISAEVVDPARLAGVSASRRAIFAGLIILLVAVMAGGLIASFRAAQREMRLARLKSEFISGVSHELRTPLTSIRIFADLLSTPGPAEKREEHAALLKREAERLSGLVERVLDFARLEKGGATYRLEERDLAAVVDEAVRTFRAPRPGFSVSVTRSSEPLRARVDSLGVEQIVHNLLDNAVKYAVGDPEVVVRREGANAILEVKDRGPGIASADLPHVFETFYRGTSETPGTGLGLAIVRQIAEAHGGSVRVASAPAEGATFTVEIPLCRDSLS